MRRSLSLSLALSFLSISIPAYAQDTLQTDSDYLQQRAVELNDRIDGAVADHKLSKAKAAKLRLSVGRVQTRAGNLQTRNGSIGRPDADQMNQQLTDVERALPLQRR